MVSIDFYGVIPKYVMYGIEPSDSLTWCGKRKLMNKKKNKNQLTS